MHAGKSKSKMTSVELSKILSSLRIAFSVSIFPTSSLFQCVPLALRPGRLSAWLCDGMAC